MREKPLDESRTRSARPLVYHLCNGSVLEQLRLSAGKEAVQQDGVAREEVLLQERLRRSLEEVHRGHSTNPTKISMSTSLATCGRSHCFLSSSSRSLKRDARRMQVL